MNGPRLIRILTATLLSLAVICFYAHELWLFTAVRSAPVAALLEGPNGFFAGFALLLTVPSLGLMVVGVARGKPEAWRGFRVLPMALVTVLAIEFIVLSSVKSPLSSTTRAKAALQVMTQEAQAMATTQFVPDDPEALEPILSFLGPVPWLVHGARPPQWQLEVHSDCRGPLTAGTDSPAGTVLYCVATGRRRAWVTLVGLPLAEERGLAGVVSAEPDWVGEVTLARENAEPADPADVDVEPTLP